MNAKKLKNFIKDMDSILNFLVVCMIMVGNFALFGLLCVVAYFVTNFLVGVFLIVQCLNVVFWSNYYIKCAKKMEGSK